ncbi:hypothetical protein HU200_026838 [Digitaria exilis]|uniref:BHLH domain-containing protein n=1 Tax=Digitaria exilis TaxID=1010633 RepID=A0A835ERI6_9POAL|nr:hypothetical protein HU200_026838 [Digitaria exilis]
MADEWWSSARTEDGASACSTVPAGTDQDAAESAPRSATSADYLRPSFHVDAAAASTPSPFLADQHHIDNWARASFMSSGRATAEATVVGFNALLQVHGDSFLLDQQPDVVDGTLVAPSAAAAASRSASSLLYADNLYSSYGDVAMAKPFSQQQQQFSGLFASSTTRSFSDVASVPAMTTKPLLLQDLEHKGFESHTEPAVQDACSSATRSGVSDSSPPANKKPRIATPSSMPTFKVRKEKLGDRITALQQLVSPFGKTDTASVLHEAIEYIRFLHDQVASLSSPYLRCGRPVQQLQQRQAKVSY